MAIEIAKELMMMYFENPCKMEYKRQDQSVA